MIINYDMLIFQDAHGKSECGCEWIYGTVVGMCDKHVNEMNELCVTSDED